MSCLRSITATVGDMMQIQSTSALKRLINKLDLALIQLNIVSDSGKKNVFDLDGEELNMNIVESLKKYL